MAVGALLFVASAATGFHVGARGAAPVARTNIVLKASRGPFPIPEPPADFAGAQWAPQVFPPFPIKINVAPAAAQVKELLKEPAAAPAPEAAAVVEAPAPEAPATTGGGAEAPPATDKSTFTVTLQMPEGSKSFECPPDMSILDQCARVPARHGSVPSRGRGRG